MAEKMKTSKINTWKPKNPDQLFVQPDGKIFRCEFARIFKQEKLEKYAKFIIPKDSYVTQMEMICNYINFFINNYDRDMELPTAYLEIKYVVDKKRTYNKSTMNGFIEFVYNTIFTKTIVEKIYALVEDNYLDDIESKENLKKYLKSEKKHLESLEFTNQHVKLLLSISFGIKILCPAMFHFTILNDIDIGKNTTTIYQFYDKLFKIFAHGTDLYDLFRKDGSIYKTNIPKTEVLNEVESLNIEKSPDTDEFSHRYYVVKELEDGKKEEMFYRPIQINMYNKLYVYVKAKVLENNASNQMMYSQREIFGTDVFTVIDLFLKKVIISDNMVKYRFNEHFNMKTKKYEESVIGFHKTIWKTGRL